MKARKLLTVFLPLVALYKLCTGAIGLNDVLRVTAQMLWNNASDVMNTFHVRVSDMGTANHDDIIEDCWDYLERIYTNIVGEIVDNITFDAINIFNETKNEPYGTFPWPTLTAGENVGQSLPINTTVNAFARTAVNKVKGGKHWPTNSETGQADGVLNTDFPIPAYLAATEDWIEGNTDLTTGADLTAGVMRTVGLGAGSLVPFASGVLHNIYHTLKNRRPDVGG